MRDVYIVGVGMTPMKGRWWDATYWKLAQLAFKALLEKMPSGFTSRMIDMLTCGKYNDMFEGHAIPETFIHSLLGLHLCEIDRVTTGGQTGMAALTRGYDAIASGRHKCVLVLGVEKAQDSYHPRTKSTTPAVIDTIAYSWPWWTQYLLGVTASSSYAQVINGYRDAYPEDLDLDARCRFIEQVCRQGRDNTLAQRYGEVVTAEGVRNSRIIISDIRFGEVCVYSEGAVTVLLADEETAKELCQATGRPLIEVAGIGHACESTYMGFEPPHKDISLIESDKVAAQRAMKMAGVTPKHIKVVGQHCAFGPQGLITLAMMGFAPIGKAASLVHDGIIVGDNPELVVDPYGGLIYAGHAVGASNMMSLREVYDFMIENGIEYGAVHGTGGADAVYGGIWILRQAA